MNPRNIPILSIFLYMVISSCQSGNHGVTEHHERKRDNIIDVLHIISIDDKLPEIHAVTSMYICGDTLLFRDAMSRGLVFTAYDIKRDSVIGQFGKFGNGPGEIANFGAVFYDPETQNLYGANANQGKIVGFHLPEAIPNPTYDAFEKCKMDFQNGNNAILSPYFINDTTVICCVYIPDKETRGIISRIGKLNLRDSRVDIIDSTKAIAKSRCHIAVSPEKNVVLSVDNNHDLIKIFNTEGKPLSYIYGPDYEADPPRGKRFFSDLQISGNKMLATYSGEHTRNSDKNIMIFDLDGNYLKTLRFPYSINSFVYHPGTDRLYLNTDGETQFGYINLQETLDGQTTTHLKNVEKDKIEIEEPTVTYKNDKDNAKKTNKDFASSSSSGILTLMDVITHHPTPVDTLNIGAYKYSDQGAKYAYSIAIRNDTKTDTVYIDSIILPDNSFLRAEPKMDRLKPGVLTTIWLWCDKPSPRQNYTITVKYKDDKYPQQKLPLKLHPSGAQLYEDYHSKGHY
ncbi:MAG: hypothetical protein NC216_10455 [Bacteroides sp.]|nr:hypothetical protein [Bacteroides sp.]